MDSKYTNTNKWGLVMGKTIQVLLSTYNGEDYINEQLESLMLQNYKDIELLIRDDGSIDDTRRLLFLFQKRYKCLPIKIEEGKNIGVTESFFNLLENSSENAYFYAFCDQDDYWNENKLSHAISIIDRYPNERPIMYCSRTQLVDENLSEMGYWPSIPKKKIELGNAIVQNVAVGCTIVINKAARDLLISKKPDLNKLIMHDWWFYLCLSSFGEVIFDPLPLIKYRQHSKNTVGAYFNPIKKMINLLREFKHNKYHKCYRRQAEEFYKLYSKELSKDKKYILENFLKNKVLIKDRLKYVLSNQVYRQSMVGNVILKILLLINRY